MQTSTLIEPNHISEIKNTVLTLQSQLDDLFDEAVNEAEKTSSTSINNHNSDMSSLEYSLRSKYARLHFFEGWANFIIRNRNIKCRQLSRKCSS